MNHKIVLPILAVLALVVSACTTPAPVAPTAIPTSIPSVASPILATPVIPVTGGSSTQTPVLVATLTAPATVAVGQNLALGSYLVDSAGMTLYIFSKDSLNTSTCTSATCASNWPPLLTNGTPTAGTGLAVSMLSTTTRADGSVQVTYNGWPLYHFSGDKAAGDILGQGVLGFWSVIDPSGMAVTSAPTPPAVNPGPTGIQVNPYPDNPYP